MEQIQKVFLTIPVNLTFVPVNFARNRLAEWLTPDDIQKDVIDNVGSDLKSFEQVKYCLVVRKD